jgi:hypothetical protein
MNRNQCQYYLDLLQPSYTMLFLKFMDLLEGCPVLKKMLSYRVWVNGITHG